MGPTCPACREPVTLGQWGRSGGWGDTFRCGGCGVVLRWQLIYPALVGIATIPVFLFAIPLGPLALFPAIASALVTHWRFGRCAIVMPDSVRPAAALRAQSRADHDEGPRFIEG